MKTSALLYSPSLFARARAVAAKSALFRGVLWTALAVGVTVGGVLAGALVVAPVVAKASQPAVTDKWQQTAGVIWSAASGMVASFSHEAVQIVGAKSRELSSAISSRSPESVGRLAMPGLVLLSMIAGLSLIAARRRSASRTASLSLVPAHAGGGERARSAARSTSRESRGRDSRTPKAVEALAASGASNSDIARRTGLPIDAIQLLLSISTGSRQVHPPTA